MQREEQPRVLLVGPSRAGISLLDALYPPKDAQRLIWGRSDGPHVDCHGPESLPGALAFATHVLIAVSDDAIELVAQRLAEASERSFADTTVIHFSGATERAKLDPLARRGAATLVFHPLRPFVAPEPGGGALRGVFCILRGEGAEARDLRNRAEAAGARVGQAQESERVRLHRGAVVASNFLTLVLELAESEFREAGLNEEEARAALASLAPRALKECLERGPAAALTGPMARGDRKVIAQHLEGGGTVAEIYRSLGRRFLKQEGRLDDATRDRLKGLFDRE